ncbi:Efflux transporter, RND family, MFP subunit [uncultured Sporomusa sp.]|uniref:Efflux transporter, RND family, MFP subunit n=1 Tax=uncultured Sporomusa sp. TaxID=307249 RepID=A0A212M0P0_9FIRM|nr:efflux RND transporter periplasmic adaptor subunit [uncultured Sporomusa sp.]SCM83336.1 Efflux transporter, RND family, MFP subunit [uncultured Sporomusa sp.]
MQLPSWPTNIPRKKLYYAFAAIAGLCILGGALWQGQPRPPAVVNEIPVVRTAVVSNSGVSQRYTYSGEVRGRYESQLAFQVNGKIITRNVQLGSTVQAGDVLLQIDAKDVVQTVNNYSAQVDSAESQLQLAASNLNRYRELLEGGAISQSQYDQYLNAYKVAMAGVRQTQSQYTQGANQLDYTLLKADKPGVVSGISAEIGQVVSAGQVIVTVVQDGEREVEISVPENRIEELRKTEKMQVSFWALPDVAAEGRIREISPIADQTTRTFKVRISLINPPPAIKLGMTATVAVAGNTDQPAINIPVAAVYQTGNSTPAVWVVTGGTITLRSIQTGYYGRDNTVQVLNGLHQGERIVIAGVHKLTEGQQVSIGGESL